VQGLRPADPLSDASRFSVKRTPITAANIDRCGAVYRVVDMLVRLKQLEQVYTCWSFYAFGWMWCEDPLTRNPLTRNFYLHATYSSHIHGLRTRHWR